MCTASGPRTPRRTECVCGRTTRARCAECGPGRRRVYETAVRDALEQREETRGFAWNARVAGTRLRPDFLWVFPSACVALEVDEACHAGYSPAAERAREGRIRAALGRPLALVRLRIPRGAPVGVDPSLLDELAAHIAAAAER